VHQPKEGPMKITAKLSAIRVDIHYQYIGSHKFHPVLLYYEESGQLGCVGNNLLHLVRFSLIVKYPPVVTHYLGGG